MAKLEPLPIQNLLKQFQLYPKKGLGQNFLIDESVLNSIAEHSGISKTTAVLEIGPGLGSLTRHLAVRAAEVTAVELDRKIIPALEKVLSPFSNVKVVQGDILECSPALLGLSDGYQVVANIPYYITSAVIRHLLNAPVKPSRVTLTVQKEVAQRICAKPGGLSLLALSVQIYGRPTLDFTIPAAAFFPEPKIDSALMHIDLFEEPLIESDQTDLFFKLAKAGYGQKRKTLRNSLASNLGVGSQRVAALLMDAEIDPMRRAETLEISEWKTLMDSFNKLQQ